MFHDFQIRHRIGIAKGWFLIAGAFLLYSDFKLAESAWYMTVMFVWRGITFYDAYFWLGTVIIDYLWAADYLSRYQEVKAEVVARTHVV